MAASSKKRKLTYDPYELLSLKRGCTDSEIDKAYKKNALKWHPDKNPDKKEKAQEMFIKVYEAYEFLKDSASRTEYDEAESVKLRKAQFEQERRSTASANRQQFIDRLKAKEKELEKQQMKANEKPAQKRRGREEWRMDEERRRARDSSLERLGREAAEMLEKRMREEEEKRRKEEEKARGGAHPAMNFNMTAEEFAKFEEEVLGL